CRGSRWGAAPCPPSSSAGTSAAPFGCSNVWKACWHQL
ncbi:MAG: hypothetical protein AVDCRST_MAG09-724, partial [uncultured Sphingomonas sp.]